MLGSTLLLDILAHRPETCSNKMGPFLTRLDLMKTSMLKAEYDLDLAGLGAQVRSRLLGAKRTCEDL